MRRLLQDNAIVALRPRIKYNRPREVPGQMLLALPKLRGAQNISDPAISTSGRILLGRVNYAMVSRSEPLHHISYRIVRRNRYIRGAAGAQEISMSNVRGKSMVEVSLKLLSFCQVVARNTAS